MVENNLIAIVLPHEISFPNYFGEKYLCCARLISDGLRYGNIWFVLDLESERHHWILSVGVRCCGYTDNNTTNCGCFHSAIYLECFILFFQLVVPPFPFADDLRVVTRVDRTVSACGDDSVDIMIVVESSLRLRGSIVWVRGSISI